MVNRNDFYEPFYTEYQCPNCSEKKDPISLFWHIKEKHTDDIIRDIVWKIIGVPDWKERGFSNG